MVQLLCFFDGFGSIAGRGTGSKGTSKLSRRRRLGLEALVLPSYAGIARVAEQLHCAAAQVWNSWVVVRAVRHLRLADAAGLELGALVLPSYAE